MISVVIEAYNEASGLGTVGDTMEALALQDYPLDQINVILVGSARQAEEWQQLGKAMPFASVRSVVCDGGNYYSFKNAGARASNDDIIAFTDSDVKPDPQWLSSIVQTIDSGADLSVGISRFQGADGAGLLPHLILSASAINWGWVLGRKQGNSYRPNGFAAHNVAISAKAFRRVQFRTDYGRTCSSMLLFQDARDAGMRVAVSRNQRVAHFVSIRVLLAINLMIAYEIVTARRMRSRLPNGWTSRFGILEPLICLLLHSTFDVPQAYRYLEALGIARARRFLVVLTAAIFSVGLRSIQAAGMCWAIVAPAQMRQWAERAVC